MKKELTDQFNALLKEMLQEDDRLCGKYWYSKLKDLVELYSEIKNQSVCPVCKNPCGSCWARNHVP